MSGAGETLPEWPTDPATGAPGGKRSWSDRLGAFVLDVRSLAVLRIGLAALILTDLYVRATDLQAHYTDAGAIPRSSVEPRAWSLSIHSLSGGAALQAILFTLAALSAVALLVGYRTRLATIVSWFLLLSLQARSPMVNSSADDLLRAQILWGMFLPLGQCWSLDSRRGRTATPGSVQVLSMASAAFVLQVCLVYWVSVGHKAHPVWFPEGSAVYYALSIDQMVTPLGKSLLAYPELLRWLTYATLALEAFGPMLLFAPRRADACRVLAIGLFTTFHLFGLGLCLNLGPFSYVASVAWLALLPTGFWEAVRRRFGRPRTPVPTTDSPLRSPWPVNALVGVIFACVLLWVSGLTRTERSAKPSPFTLVAFDVALGLTQAWNMFAPYPWTGDGWYVAVGTTPDGRQLDAWNDGGPVSWEKPERVAEQFKNERWRKYLENVVKDSRPEVREPLVGHLLRRWNETHGESEQLAALDLYFVQERTLPDYRTEAPRRILLARHDASGAAPR